MRQWLRFSTALLCLSTLGAMGCTRNHYRLRADKDAYARIIEKSACKPWAVPGDYSVYPKPHSRLYDPTCVNDPCLPDPAPQLYAYELPPLPQREDGRFFPNQEAGEEGVTPQLLPAPDEAPLELPTPSASSVEQARFVQSNPAAPSDAVLFETLLQEDPAVSADADDGARSTEDTDEADNSEETEETTDPDSEVQARLVPLPKSYWESIPPECLSRMFAFKSVREEYERTYGVPPREAQLDNSPELSLEDIIDLTLLNSRDLQTQKEQLFQVALVLTLQRFEFQLRPSIGNNGSALDYAHSRNGGITQNTLLVPTTAQLERMTYAGADVIGRFANRVLLTFNGPSGFDANVSSDLLFNFSQSLLQRDIRLEALTQAERNVVYAARDFTRFRKVLFVRQATDYYSLIRQFRQIEIQCQNYFTLAREFNQRSIEIKYGMAARTQLDQVEQQVINGRQSILSSCTNLENSLDSLKIEMGLPTEQPLNLDLTELNLLTLRDELAVTAELIERTRIRIDREIQSETRSAFVIIGGVAQLAEQMINSLALRKQLGDQSLDSGPLENRILDLRIEAADIDIAEDMDVLRQELQDEEPDSTKLVQRRRDVCQELLRKVLWQIRRLETSNDDELPITEWADRYDALSQRLTDLENNFINIIFREQAVDSDDNPDDLTAAENALIGDAESLQADLETLTSELDRKLGRFAATEQREFTDRAIEFAKELIATIERFRTGLAGGLVPIEIEMDDAMMTALVQRFDLMNQRGFLADDWRQIKYAGDDLRSILNLNASQSIRTRGGENKPFDFTFDESQTSLALSFDLPLNRRAQRNGFRNSLFSYQQTLRSVMALEDNIKLSIRRDLRELKLNGQQYDNDVAGAALASERVTGTELEVRGGFATSRDFLESQQAYVQAISGVASGHINYIVGRLQLFLDLESLTVGDNGFWDELYDEEHQPTPMFQIPGYARPAYGCLHPRLKYSDKIRRMECVPTGASMIHDPERNRVRAESPEAEGEGMMEENLLLNSP